YNIRGTQDVTAIVVGEALKKMGLGYLEAQLQKLQGRALSSGTSKGGFIARAFEALSGKSKS
ncbi:MAG: hypothetical protein WCJ71_11825, partial [Candidatus Omnitrophota bacterium]